jgi:hypothetical protein
MACDWQITQVMTALRRGASDNARTSTRVRFDGEAEMFSTFQGPRWFAVGRLDFWHYDSRVMTVDFNKDLVTDFGYLGYSAVTTRTISGWMRVLHGMRFTHTASLDGSFWPFDWTWDYGVSPKARPRGEGWHEEMRDRFRARAPWVTTVDGQAWFHGPGWDPVLWDRYNTLRRELLGDRTHVWYTADWDAKGHWTKRFIDADAKRRWDAAQKRRQRAEAKAQANWAYTSGKTGAAA